METTMNENNSRVAIVILSWNGKDFIERCLSSVLKQTYKNFEVFFVDNGSSDGSANFVQSHFPSVNLLALDSNCGVAKGLDIGIKEAFKELNIHYILLLNIDVTLEDGFIKELVDVAKSDSLIGSCQSKMLLMDQPTIIDAVGVTMSKNGTPIQIGWDEQDTGQYGQITEVFGANGAATLYRVDMLKQIGLFDGDFYAYYEDVDLILRARLAGWKCMFVPKAIVYHKHSHAFRKDSQLKEYLLVRNHYYYVIKDLPMNLVFRFLVRKVKNVVGLMIRIVLRSIILNRTGVRANARHLKAHYDAIKNIPVMVAKRRDIQSKRVISNRELVGWFQK